MQMTDRRRFAAVLAVSLIVVAGFYIGATTSLTKLVENRGVGDDVCYMRQSLLFRERGAVGGLDTDSADARYIAGKFKQLKLPVHYTPIIQCERFAPANGHVMSFFLTHPVPSQYYTLPPTLLTIWTIIFAWHASGRTEASVVGTDAPTGTRRAWSAVALVCGLVVFLSAVIAPALARKSPPGPTTIALEPNAVVWTAGETWQNPIARGLEIYLNRHAISEFDTAPPETVDALLASIAKDGRPQYFVNQSPGMAEIAKRGAAFGKVQTAGTIFGVETDRLDPQ